MMNARTPDGSIGTNGAKRHKQLLCGHKQHKRHKRRKQLKNSSICSDDNCVGTHGMTICRQKMFDVNQ